MPADFPAVKGSLAASVDRNVFPGIQGGPLMHVIAAKAVAFKLAAEETFREDQRRTIANAQVLATDLTSQGARVVSGGTDNHLLLVDVTPLGVTGKEAEHLLDEIGITVNKNAIPFDTPAPEHRVGDPDRDARPRRRAGSGTDEMEAVEPDHDRRHQGAATTLSVQRPTRRRGPRHRRAIPGAGAARGVNFISGAGRAPVRPSSSSSRVRPS